LDATELHNLAGKYKGQYGTPFDLEDLKKDHGLLVTGDWEQLYIDEETKNYMKLL